MNYALYVIAAIAAVRPLSRVYRLALVPSGPAKPPRKISPSGDAAATVITVLIEAAIVVVLVLAALRLS